MDVNTTYRNAETAYQNKDFLTALRHLSAVTAAIGDNPAVLHLTGLCLKGSGQIEKAISCLEKAAKLAAGDPQIANNLGNSLLQAGRATQALVQYSRALTLQDNFSDARLNRAICLHGLSRLEDARADFRILQKSDPNISRMWSALGTMELDAHEYETAKQAYLKALELQPDNINAKSGLAKASLELGEVDAEDLYDAAMALNPEDVSLAAGRAYARQTAGYDDAADALIPLLEANPEWIQGHETLASILWEAGDSDNYTARFRTAVQAAPHNDDMRVALAKVFADSQDIENAYAVLQDRPEEAPVNPQIQLMQANFASELMLEQKAAAHFARLPVGDVDIEIYRAKHALRFERPDQAETLLTPISEEHPGNIAAWAFLDICWRLNGDDRHNWLHGQDGLYGLSRLELDADDIADIGDHLRGLHIVKAQPLGQSLRGGTQTKGHLLERPDPVIQKLRDAIEKTVSTHWTGLPDADKRHPLLRHRSEQPAIRGSWSVQLTEKGFHVQHIHPQGLLSSACYLILPEMADADDNHEGWLELGRAAPDFAWEMEPIAQIRPKAGHIALFPSTLFHGTVPFNAGERISVAFDVVTNSASKQ